MQHRSPETGSMHTRRDGWTPERQLRFLDALARSRSVTQAARAAGMTRESAYRLRKRRDGALFAAAWDRAMESHTRVTVGRRQLRQQALPNRAKLRKVTKLKKFRDAGFRSLLAQMRDFAAPTTAAPENPCADAIAGQQA
jgi:molybdenum-dependent DNA-binding transcriptional regulator ModE